jgi:hypothetical protein
VKTEIAHRNREKHEGEVVGVCPQIVC